MFAHKIIIINNEICFSINKFAISPSTSHSLTRQPRDHPNSTPKQVMPPGRWLSKLLPFTDIFKHLNLRKLSKRES